MNISGENGSLRSGHLNKYSSIWHDYPFNSKEEIFWMSEIQDPTKPTMESPLCVYLFQRRCLLCIMVRITDSENIRILLLRDVYYLSTITLFYYCYLTILYTPLTTYIQLYILYFMDDLRGFKETFDCILFPTVTDTHELSLTFALVSLSPSCENLPSAGNLTAMLEAFWSYLIRALPLVPLC